jgi:hypothetical protein
MARLGNLASGVVGRLDTDNISKKMARLMNLASLVGATFSNG